MRKGWQWPLALGALLLGGVLANVLLMVRAVDDPSFSVEPDYYEKGVAWDAHQAQAARNRDLGWKAAIDVGPAARDTRRAAVIVQLTDRDGRPVEGARLSVEAFHNARASQVVRGTLNEDARHAYAAALPVLRPGLWEFRVEARRGSDVFTSVVDQDAPGLMP